MNLIQIAGHLGADAETRFTPSGQKVVNLRVATNSRRGNKDETIWWRVTLWGDRFDKLLPYLKKGSSLIIIGEMSKPEIYVDKEGNSQVTLNITAEIIRFSPFGKGEKQSGEQGQHQQDPNGMETGYGYNQESHQSYGYSPPPSNFAGHSQSFQAQPFPGSAPQGNSFRNAHSESNYSIENDELPF